MGVDPDTSLLVSIKEMKFQLFVYIAMMFKAMTVFAQVSIYFVSQTLSYFITKSVIGH
jgi:hypothetical protein